MDPRGVFDEFATNYDETVQSAIGASGETVEFFAALRAELIANMVPAGTESLSVLDFGCGIGNMTREVAARLPFGRIVGTDISERSLATARATRLRDRDIDYAVTHTDRLPFADSSFDLVFTSGVFHHIEPADRLHWASEVRRVLTPRGRFFLFEHNPWNPLTVQVVRRIPFDRGVKLLSSRYASTLLRRAGFTVSRPHYYFFFPKALRSLRRFEPSLRRLPIGAQYLLIGQV